LELLKIDQIQKFIKLSFEYLEEFQEIIKLEKIEEDLALNNESYKDKMNVFKTKIKILLLDNIKIIK